jgi:diguanylate cyclase (GGDEF)-like protein
MPLTLLDPQYDLTLVLLSFLIACLASYVTLDLAERVRGPDRLLARGWWIAGSLSMGTGIWSMHFVGMLALRWPFEVGYDTGITGLSWVAAVGVSALALRLAAQPQLGLARWTGGALLMGAGISTMHYTGMAALALEPGVRWHAGWVAASVVVAVVASAAALQIFFWLRGQRGRRAVWWKALAAVVMGTAIVGMHYTGMAAAGFPADAICRSLDGLGGDALNGLVALAATGLLGLTLLTSVVDRRLRRRAERLEASLDDAHEELRRLAFRDALTGLPNRLLFDDRVEQAVQRSRRQGGALVVLFIDLDGFKPINDSFGHAVGDAVLREMARRLAAHARASDTVARLGGDEFVALLEGDVDTAAAAQIAQRVIDTLSLPVVLEDRELRLSCSVGLALHDGRDAGDKLLQQADSAMYAAKRAGGGGYAFFEPHMDAGVREQVELHRDLRVALEQGGQLLLHYQPKVGTRQNDRLTGVEALVRWQHPVRGLIGPVHFIPVAERFGLIGALGDWVIEEACRQVRAWLDEGLQLHVAINLSVHQLRQDDLTARIDAALQRHALDASMLTFEITESVAMEDGEGTMKAFDRLHGMGLQLSIDDFGTGYSSLSYLRKLQARELKIDRSFVRDLEGSADARAIVQAVVQLAHALDLRVVAEGVETEGQRLVLHSLRCDELQGFLFARPMPADEVARWAVAAAAQPAEAA